VRTVEQIQTDLLEIDAELADHHSGQRPLEPVTLGMLANRHAELRMELTKAQKEAHFLRRRSHA
jgi:hypothetical protein